MSEQNQPGATAESSGVTGNSESGSQHKAVPQRDSQGVSLITACVVAAIFSAFSGGMSWYLATRHAAELAASAPVVVLDSSRIAEKKMQAAISAAGATPEKAAQEGKAFVEALDKTLAEYSAAGIVVVNSSVVINRPSTLDITQAVARKLNVKLD